MEELKNESCANLLCEPVSKTYALPREKLWSVPCNLHVLFCLLRLQITNAVKVPEIVCRNYLTNSPEKQRNLRKKPSIHRGEKSKGRKWASYFYFLWINHPSPDPTNNSEEAGVSFCSIFNQCWKQKCQKSLCKACSDEISSQFSWIKLVWINCE